MTSVGIRAPASLQTRAAAFSNGNPLSPRIPATEQAARWWPRQSKGPATPAVASGQGNGRVEATEMEGAELLGTKLGEPASGEGNEGNETRGQIAIASAPLCGSHRGQQTVRLRVDFVAATLCHPNSPSTASEFGRNPSARSTHEGNLKPTSCISRPHQRTDCRPTEGNSTERPVRMLLHIAICLFRITWKQSAHMAQ